VTSKSTSFAITAIVPYPRVGSTSERRNAKAYPDNKVPVARIESIAKELLRALKAYLDFETTAYRQAAMAIHEIRKLNAVVKQTAERLGQSGRMPSEEDLLRIRKTSDMMSQIFTAIHVLADESIAKLPMNSRSEIYKLIEKVLWIYTPETSEVGVSFHSLPRGYSGPVNACDVTLPLIPSALIQNAFQYATPGTTIDVVVAQAEDCRSVEVRVSNQCRRHSLLDDRVFDKGIRFSSDVDGSGHGLYIAKLVAKQHRGDLRVQSQMLDSETCLCTFVLTLPQMAN
jgi:signal transduction histidine kinase